MTHPCKDCGLPVQWRLEKPAGKPERWQYFNPNGSVHWDLCSKTRTARVKREGKRYELRTRTTVIEHGYQHRKLGTKAMYINGGTFVGANYRPLPCAGECRTPPWEGCPACPHTAAGA